MKKLLIVIALVTIIILLLYLHDKGLLHEIIGKERIISSHPVKPLAIQPDSISDIYPYFEDMISPH